MTAIPEFDPIEANYQQATGVFVATSKLGEVLEAQDVYITNSGFPVFDYNMVFVKRPDHELAASLEKAARYFEGRKLPYRVCVRADRADECRSLLLPRGFAEPQPFPGMQLSPIPEVPKAPAGLEIRRVCDAETLADFQKTAFEGFGLPSAAAPLVLTEHLLPLPGVVLFAGYAGGEPVCTSGLVVTAGVAGVYWVATLERFRGRGYGEAATWQAVAAGQEIGCDVASLQASEMGRPVDERMGFVNDRDYARFDSPEA